MFSFMTAILALRLRNGLIFNLEKCTCLSEGTALKILSLMTAFLALRLRNRLILNLEKSSCISIGTA